MLRRDTETTPYTPDEVGEQRLSTGVEGLDEILNGGLMPGRTYLVRGGPGTGKTTLGCHVMSTGTRNGERCLYITMEEPADRIRDNARAIGLDLQEIPILDLSPTSEFFRNVQVYDIFAPGEVEQGPIAQRIIEMVESVRPQRLFLEAVTQFQYLTPDAFQFHKQVLSFLRFLTEQGATVLFTSEASPTAPDDDLRFLSDAVIELTLDSTSRYIGVSKLRGSDFRAGYHSMELTREGIRVFPRLLPEGHGRKFVVETVPSGIPELDEMLHGGLSRSMSTILTGPSGVGKSTLAMQFVKEAAGRGERSVAYLFEESRESAIRRCEAVNIPIRAMIERGVLSLVQVDALRYSPDEFAALVREEVEKRDARIVLIDSLAGYRLSIRASAEHHAPDLVRHVYALTMYLRNMGATCLITNEVESITGDFRITELGISYMIDNIIFLRYMEINGALHRAIGVLKKRMSDFQKTMRELEITTYGVKVGGPLAGLRGILTGTPELLNGHNQKRVPCDDR